MLWTLLIGLIVGVVAKFLMPGEDSGGFILTTLLGIGGAIVANWAGSAMGIYRAGEAAGFISAVLGAMLILFLYRMLSSKRSSS